jgi:hypothetical protein
MFKKINFIQLLQDDEENNSEGDVDPGEGQGESDDDQKGAEGDRFGNSDGDRFGGNGDRFSGSDEDDNDEDDDDEGEWEGGWGGEDENEDVAELEGSDIQMVNEWNANKRTGLTIDVYEKNEKNKEFNKNVYVYSKMINEHIIAANDEYELSDGDIRNIQLIAGKIDDIEYINTVCFILAYKFKEMNKKKENYLEFIMFYIKITDHLFGYMNIGKKDVIKYIIFLKNLKKIQSN